MKTKFLLFLILTLLLAKPFTGFCQAVNKQDSLALVALYDSTNGPGWSYKPYWKTTSPLGYWYGVTVTGGRVTALSLGGRGLTNKLPAAIGQLTALQQLELPFNSLTGSVPAAIGNLTALASLDLRDNKFTSLPSSLGKLVNLTFLNIGYNLFSGSAPASINSLRKLQNLSLSGNSFTGSIPAGLSNLDSLVYLFLGGNRFTGSIPASFGSFTKLQVLDVSVNQLSGTIPLQLANLAAIKNLYIYNNRFTFSGLEALVKKLSTALYYTPQQNIDIHQNGGVLSVSAGLPVTHNTYKWYKNGAPDTTITGDSTRYVGNSASYYTVSVTNSVATALTLTSNILVLPQKANTQDSLALVSLYNATKGAGWVNKTNWLSGPVAKWYGVALIGGRVIQLNLSNNNLAGKIPAGIGTLTALKQLSLSLNKLTDTLPASLLKLVNLESLDLSVNTLTGKIPAIGALTHLTYLALANNGFTGSIPDAGNLADLQYLSLSHNALTGSIPAWLGQLTKLTYLYLSYNQFSGTIPSSLGNLKNVQFLQLDNNKLTGNIPEALSGLVNVQFLLFTNNNLSGTVADIYSNLTKLVDVGISKNNFTYNGIEQLVQKYGKFSFLDYYPQKNIPIQVNGNTMSVSAGGTLKNNTYTWYNGSTFIKSVIGDSTYTTSQPGKYWVSVTNSAVIWLTLNSDTVNATYTANTQDSLTLVEIYKSNGGSKWKNNTGWLAGPVKNWYGVTLNTLGRVTNLNLFNNNVNGNLISNIGNLSELQTLLLAYNNLTGAIPAEIGKLTKLQTLWLHNNQLSGPIPAAISSLKQLSDLLLQDNRLTFSGMSYVLGLAGNKQYTPQQSPHIAYTAKNLRLQGGSPAIYEWHTDTGIIKSAVNDSAFTPGYCGKYWVVITSPAVKGLTLYSDTFRLQHTASKQDSLVVVDIYNSMGGAGWKNNKNWLTTAPLVTWPGITLDTGGRVAEVLLGYNNLTGALPASISKLSRLKWLHLGNNGLSGALPSQLAGLDSLQRLNLSLNKYSGTIPTAFGRLKNLTELDLSINSLSGTIPDTLGAIATLQVLDLSHNKFTGSIPVALGRLGNLTFLNLLNNGLTGSIPAELGKLVKLELLELLLNKLTGTIPSALGNLAKLHILSLSQNQLTGSIPVALGKLGKLEYMDLDYNKLSGSIPAALGNDSSLSRLGLSYNALTGSIPTELSKLTKLTDLNLRNNKLSGIVPVSLINLSNASIDVSYNNFTFEGLEPICSTASSKIDYNPQSTVLKLHKTSNKLSVLAGGTLAKNTYTWYKNGAIAATKTGDSTFTTTGAGKYSVAVTNKVAYQLTLYSDTLTTTSLIGLSGETGGGTADALASGKITGGVQLYPNPATSTAIVQFTAAKAAKYTLQLIEASGRIIKQLSGTSAKGANNITLDVHALPSATYMVTITNGNERKTFTLVKQ